VVVQVQMTDLKHPGYKEDFEPTVNKDGDYHTINGDSKQIQYQGSEEQKKDLDAIDKYMEENPNF